MAPDPPVPVAIELGSTLHPLLARGGQQRLKDQLAQGLSDLCAEVSIPGEAVPDVRTVSSRRMVRVRVHGALQAYSPDLMRRVWLAVTPRKLHSVCVSTGGDARPGFPDGWFADYIDKALLEPSRPGPVLDYLGHLVEELLRAKAGCLLGPAQVRAYVGERIPAESTQFVTRTLQALLNFGVSLMDKQPILAILDESWSLGRSVRETIEVAYAAQRRRQLEVHIAPQYFAAITGQVLRRPVWAYARELDPRLMEPFRVLYKEILADVGLELPPLLWVPSKELKGQTITVRINDHLRLPPVQGPKPGELLVNQTVSHLRSLGLSARPAIVPATGVEVAMVEEAARGKVEAAGLDVWAPIEFAPIPVLSMVTRNGGCFIDVLGVEHQLALLENNYPELVHFIEMHFTSSDITQMLRSLVQERVSIRDLRGILERLALYDTIPASDPSLVVFDDRLPVEHEAPFGLTEDWQRYREFVRAGLRDYLNYRYLQDPKSLFVYTTTPELEARARALPGDHEKEQIRDLFWSRHSEATERGRRPVLRTTRGARAAIREVLEPEVPQVPVLADTEMSTAVDLDAVDEIG